jgi:hypothetical protein
MREVNEGREEGSRMEGERRGEGRKREEEGGGGREEEGGIEEGGEEKANLGTRVGN